MTNSQITKTLFSLTDEAVKESILNNIAGHYGITHEEVLDEILDDEAEHLLDYVTGYTRDATHVIMKRHNLVAK